MPVTGQLPSRIVAGESIWISASNTVQDKQDLTFVDYTPAGGYTLAYRFAAATPITVDASANGGNTGWTLDVTAAQTVLWGPGPIRYAGMATKTATSRVFAIDEGTIQVAPSPLATSAWAAVVSACDAALLESPGAGSFTVDGMTFTYRTPKQIIELREYAQRKADEEVGVTSNRPVFRAFKFGGASY